MYKLNKQNGVILLTDSARVLFYLKFKLMI